ncbi:FxsA family protein [uncultured Tessaracoccus sp.]|uniref:FxsA family protein n=1 Tax=uncultured Tessaracoccus sp. TaxID=905023 RepID=UPI00262E7CB5|nr:FxsA family protein [uncultured Tessaracoccus sp.]
MIWAIAEIAVLIWLSRTIGWWTLFLLVGTSLAGVVLLMRAGKRSLHRFRQRALTEEPLPEGENDTSQVMFGSVLLIIPGFISDVIGLLFVLPFTRPLLKASFDHMHRWAMRRKAERQAAEEGVIPGEVVNEAPETSPDNDNDPLMIEGTVIDDAEGWPGQ